MALSRRKGRFRRWRTGQGKGRIKKAGDLRFSAVGAANFGTVVLVNNPALGRMYENQWELLPENRNEDEENLSIHEEVIEVLIRE
jgi:hypothetical protein